MAEVLKDIRALRVGDCMILTSPMRVCKVVETGLSFKVEKDRGRQIEEVSEPAVRVVSTIPTTPQAGILSKERAKEHGELCKRVWTEFWAELDDVVVGPDHGVLSVLDNRATRSVFVVEHNPHGRPIEGLNNSRVELKMLETCPPELNVHDPDSGEQPEDEPGVDLEGMTFLELKALAGKRGVDISDLSGEGTAAKIRERLSGVA